MLLNELWCIEARKADKRKSGDFKNVEAPPLGGYPFFKYDSCEANRCRLGGVNL